MLSLTYGVRFDAPQSRAASVSFSVNKRSGLPSQQSQYSPSVGWVAWTNEPPRDLVPDALTARNSGRRSSRPQDHVLRYHSVGRRWRTAGSGPRFVTEIWTRMSSGEFFAYST